MVVLTCGMRTLHTFDAMSIETYPYMPADNLLQVKSAQPGEEILFTVGCKDIFNNSRSCLLSINEANQKIQVDYTYVYSRENFQESS